MIGKLIRMKCRVLPHGKASTTYLQALKRSVIGLTRYVVDAHPEGLKSAGANVIALTDYALEAEAFGAEPGEKVEAFGARNLVGGNLRDWQMQMLAVVASNPRIQEPILHLMLSLRSSECWTAEQREEAIDIVVQTMGLENCQLIWSEHGNTTNPHIHLAVVPIHPATGKKAGGSWPIDDLHQALALIDERQGRIREQNAIYEARGGVVYHVETGLMVRTADGTYLADWRSKARDISEQPTSEMLRLRSTLLEITEKSNSWSQLHRKLAEFNITYDRKGSGAQISVGQSRTKASTIHRSLSFKVLEKRWGPFEPDLSRLDAGYEAYCHSLSCQLSDLRKQRDTTAKDIHTWASSLIAKYCTSKAVILRKAIRAEEAAAKQAMKDAYASAIKQCTDQRLTYEKWTERGQPDFKVVAAPIIMRPSDIASDEQPSHESELIQKQIGWSTEYHDPIGTKLFTDHRAIIIVHAADRLDSIDAALTIAASRWNSVTVSGSPEFVALATARAQKLGIEMRLKDAPVPKPKGLQNAYPFPVSASTPAPVRPIVRTPPARELTLEQQVAEALTILKRHPWVPLRRIERLGSQPIPDRSGPLEIPISMHILGEHFDELRKVSLLAQRPEVQAELQKLRNMMLSTLRSRMEIDTLQRVPNSNKEILALLALGDPIRPAVNLAFGDKDLADMLAGIRIRMMNREREKQSRRESLAEQTSAPSVDDDILLQLQQQVRGRGRGMGR